MSTTVRTFVFSRVAFPKTSSRVSLIRFNRLLAWAMLISPVLQLWLGTSLELGFAVDFGIFVAHCLLSLYLFGMPKRKGGGFESLMHVFGVRARGMSPRNDFLMGGYRIFLGVAWALCFFLPGVGWFALPGGFYIFVRMPLTLAGHVIAAVTLALRRHGLDRMAESGAVLIAAFYLVASLCNFFLR